MNKTGVMIVQHLSSTHKEADTRVVLHVIDLTLGHSITIVRCDDIYVLLILLYYCSKGVLDPETYM